MKPLHCMSVEMYQKLTKDLLEMGSKYKDALEEIVRLTNLLNDMEAEVTELKEKLNATCEQ